MPATTPAAGVLSVTVASELGSGADVGVGAPGATTRNAWDEAVVVPVLWSVAQSQYAPGPRALGQAKVVPPPPPPTGIGATPGMGCAVAQPPDVGGVVVAPSV